MKKHNRLFSISITGLIFAVVGIILMGIGISIGGSRTYLSINRDTAPWWPFSGNIGFGGWSEQLPHTTTKKSFQPKEYMEVYVSAGDIEIRKGKEDMCILYNIAEDKLKIKDEQNRLFIDVVSSENHSGEQKIILELKHPEKVKVMKACADVGNLDISNIQVEELHAGSDVGDLELKNVQAKNGIISSGTGDIELEHTVFDTTEMYSDVGDIAFDGNIKESGVINNQVGDVELSLLGTKDMYDFVVASSLGDIEIDDETYSYEKVQVNPSAKQKIQVTCDAGSIDIDFR